MARNPYLKSLILLVSAGGIGYLLMRLTEPSAEKIQKIRASATCTHLTEDEQKKLLFMKRLQEATNATPVYMQKKEN